jgi:ComF family protein
MHVPSRLNGRRAGVLDQLLEALFPAHCVACGVGGAWLCPACIAAVPGRGALSPVAWLHVGTGDLDEALALSPHVYPLREAVHGLKYGGMRVLADPLAALLAAGWQARGAPPVDLVVPVPLHRAQLRRRGYNQAGLLAAHLGERIDVAYLPAGLRRLRETRSQVGLSAEERMANVQGAFTCDAPAVSGARVVLIDDVLTTGATLSACAHALRAAGAREVWGLALTCALLHDTSPALDGRR